MLIALVVFSYAADRYTALQREKETKTAEELEEKEIENQIRKAKLELRNIVKKNTPAGATSELEG